MFHHCRLCHYHHIIIVNIFTVKTSPSKSLIPSWLKIWRSVGVILPTTAYILRLKSPPVRFDILASSWSRSLKSSCHHSDQLCESESSVFLQILIHFPILSTRDGRWSELFHFKPIHSIFPPGTWSTVGWWWPWEQTSTRTRTVSPCLWWCTWPVSTSRWHWMRSDQK